MKATIPTSTPTSASASVSRRRSQRWTLVLAALLHGACSGFSPVNDDGGGAADGGPTSDAAALPGCTGLPTWKAGSLLGDASNGSLTSQIAQGHGRVAVVWEDVGGQRVWLALLDTKGTVQLQPIVIANGVSPAITASARGFAVLVHDVGASDIVFVEVAAADGKVLVQPRALGATDVDSLGGYPAIARQGSRYLAIYTAGTQSTRFELRKALLGEDGTKVGGWTPLLASADSNAIADLVAVSDGGFAAAWIDERAGKRRIFAARLDADGKLRATPGEVQVSSDAHVSTFPDIAVGPGGALLICYSINAGPQNEGDVLCGLMAADGKVDVTERLTDNPEVSSFPEVVRAGSNYLVVFNDERPGIGEVFGQFVDNGGHRVGPTLRLTDIAATSGYPQVAWVDDAALITWYQYRATTGWSYEYQRFACER